MIFDGLDHILTAAQLKQAMNSENARVQPQDSPKREPTVPAKPFGSIVDATGVAAATAQTSISTVSTTARYASLDEQSKKHNQQTRISEKGAERMLRAKVRRALSRVEKNSLTVGSFQ